MSQEALDRCQHAEMQAEELLHQLNRHYADYLEKYQDQQRSQSLFAKLFGKWFTSLEPSSADSLHQDFLAGVERIVSGLTATLKQLELSDPHLCQTLAEKAVDRLMMPKPEKEKTQAEWYMAIAEYQAEPLLPYLSREALQRHRDLLLKRVPKRMMYPRQRQLLERVEELIKVKEVR